MHPKKNRDSADERSKEYKIYFYKFHAEAHLEKALDNEHESVRLLRHIPLPLLARAASIKTRR
jgi:hypothetical protein